MHMFTSSMINNPKQFLTPVECEAASPMFMSRRQMDSKKIYSSPVDFKNFQIKSPDLLNRDENMYDYTFDRYDNLQCNNKESFYISTDPDLTFRVDTEISCYPSNQSQPKDVTSSKIYLL